MSSPIYKWGIEIHGYERYIAFGISLDFGSKVLRINLLAWSIDIGRVIDWDQYV